MSELFCLVRPWHSPDHAETDFFDYDTAMPRWEPCWNLHVTPWHTTDMINLTICWRQCITAMLKLTILTTTNSCHTETDNFDHNTLQQRLNLNFWPWHLTDMIKLTFSTTSYSSHAETDILNKHLHLPTMSQLVSELFSSCLISLFSERWVFIWCNRPLLVEHL